MSKHQACNKKQWNEVSDDSGVLHEVPDDSGELHSINDEEVLLDVSL